MYPFWEPIVSPLIAVARARRVVEIGALRGENTVKMLEDLGPDSEIHVIDPVPAFDPAEHEQQFPGRYVFHRGLSLDVLPDLDAFDVAVIDGDHNWYSVYNELKLLASAARRADRPMPLSILHDVAWPYGRRDLYYDPSNIPAEHRRPFAYRGMRPGRSELNRQGGMNIGLANALEEGGPRNGVMTGLEDFLAEHDRPVRSVVLPIYFGLAIVAEVEMLNDNPALTEFLDRLESPEGTNELLVLSERIRIDEVVFSHNIERMRDNRLERAIDRHLAVLGASLDLPVTQIRTLDAAVRPLVESGAPAGDIVHAGSEAGLRYLAGVLDSFEVTDRSLWAIGADLAGTASELDDHVRSVDEATWLPADTHIAMLSVDGDDGELRAALGERITTGAVVASALQPDR